MGRDNSETSFQRGVMPLVILSLLSREDMYGYQIVQEIARISDGGVVTQEGSLYPVLYKLQEQNLVSTNKVLVGKRMTRIYYHIEDAGRAHLQELIKAYEMVTMGVRRIIEEGRQ